MPETFLNQGRGRGGGRAGTDEGLDGKGVAREANGADAATGCGCNVTGVGSLM